jgi:hypothetical protein
MSMSAMPWPAGRPVCWFHRLRDGAGDDERPPGQAPAAVQQPVEEGGRGDRALDPDQGHWPDPGGAAGQARTAGDPGADARPPGTPAHDRGDAGDDVEHGAVGEPAGQRVDDWSTGAWDARHAKASRTAPTIRRTMPMMPLDRMGFASVESADVNERGRRWFPGGAAILRAGAREYP